MNQTSAYCCYLCNSQDLTKARTQRGINYDGHVYYFYKCKSCGSYSIFPRLEDDTVAKLYSKEYSELSAKLHEGHSIDYCSKFAELKKFLFTDSRSMRKSYLDYGCGFNPVTLGIASTAGLDCLGVEFSSDVVAQANQISLGKVSTVAEFKKTSRQFDYIFMGDVIEHLIHPRLVLVEISSRLSAHGVLIAQGPLQGAFTFTHMLVGMKSRLFQKSPSNYPPYHVSLATKSGMKKLLDTCNLEIIYMKISDPLWPAPSLSSLLRRPSARGMAIFASKLLDRTISRFIPKYGSHYFIVAQKCTR